MEPPRTPPISTEAERARRRRAARRRLRAQRVLALTALAVVAAVAVAVAGSSGPAHSKPHAATSRPVQDVTAAKPARHLGPIQRARARAVAWAVARNGMHEIGTTNCSPAIDRWERHMGIAVPPVPPCAPWCGAFVHEAFYQAGIHLSGRLMDPNASYWDAKAHANGLKAIPKGSVQPGDIVFFELDPGVQASHEALVVAPPQGGKVRTAEGNVGHHAVVTRRGLRYVVLAARVTRRPA